MNGDDVPDPQLDSYPHDLAGEPAAPPTSPSPRELAQARRAAGATRAAARPAEPARTAAGDQVAPAILALVSSANAANSSRDKTSDGTWGDKAHQAQGSATDHNPWLKYAGHGWVRAADLDVDGLDLAAAWERARQLAVAGQLPQLVDGGYLILNRRITAPDFSGWRAYSGPNPHVLHGHCSVSRDPDGFMATGAWPIFAPASPAPTPPASPAPTGWTGPDATGRGPSLRAQFQPGPQTNGPRMAEVQAFLRRVYPAYAGDLVVDGWYGQQTAGVVAEFARRSSIAGADGLNIGPKIATALWRAGLDR